MTDEIAPAVVVGKDAPRSFRLLGLRLPKQQPAWLKRSSSRAAIVIAIAVVAIGGYWWYKAAHNPNITIGKTVITPAEIKELSSEISKYTIATHNRFSRPALQTAQDDLVLNAALKDQAVKHNLTVTQADIDVQQAPQYQHYGSKAAYQNYLRAANIVSLTNVTAENNTYEAKLQNVVIAQKSYFIVAINYDTPFFDNSSVPAALRAQATKTMQTKFLPLFKQGKSEAQIAAQTDINYTLRSPTVNEGAYQLISTGTPSMAYYVLGCTTAKPCFNDLNLPKFDSVSGIVSTSSEIAKLTKAGQYTNVFTSKAGFIGIVQLKSRTSGAYNSWQDLLNSYKHKYTPKFAVALNSGLNRI